MSTSHLRRVLQQAFRLGTIRWIYFEGGEPFLYFPILVQGVQEASDLGFQVGVVTNGYWANTDRDALEWLRPMVGYLDDLSISRDRYHGSEENNRKAEIALNTAQRLGIPSATISIAQPEDFATAPAPGQLPPGESGVAFRGRAAETLAARGGSRPWESLTECPHENFRDPGRLHVDPFGNLQVCQGLSLGNVFQSPLAEIIRRYEPEKHPIIGPLLEGGPAALARRYEVPTAKTYADACHLCYEVRRALRERFPKELGPDQMYGVPED
jgi:MoaA/NifB/PqqE/SkfB family radical SAM enzyme